MTEQTSALKSKENNNAAGNQTKQAKRRKPQNQMQQSHGKPPMQKAAPGTTKRIFGYVFQYKWRVALVVVCILVGAAAQAGSSLFLQSLIDTYILPMVGASDPDWMPLLRALTLMACLYAAGIFCSWLWQWVIVTVEQGMKIVIPHFVVIKREVFLLIAILRHRTHPVGMHLFIPGTPELLVHGCTGNDFEWYAYMIDFQNIQILPECFFHIIRRHFVLCLIVHVEDAYFSIQIMFTDIINA